MEERKWVKKIIAAALFTLICLMGTCALGETAQNITDQFKITVKSKYKVNRLYDGNYQNKWESNAGKDPSIVFQASEDVKAYGLYICFAKMPDAWEIQTQDEQGQWQTVFNGDTRFLHTYVALPGLNAFRLIAPSEKNISLQINNLSLFSQGALPEDVQIWEKPGEKADMLVLVAHPDDELIMMGGTIPIYAVEKQMNVLVAYMTVSNTTRSSELLNGLWSMGYKTYPILGTFGDSYSSNLEAAYKAWKAKEVRTFVMGLVRKYQPEVVVSHDLNGEYGHGAHMVCAQMAVFCVQNGANKAIEPELYELYGGWEPKKLYLHLYKENTLTMNWHIPLSSLNSRTALEAAQDAYKFHLTQRSTKFAVKDEGNTNCALFGLYYTSVGPDANGDDFMENIPGKGAITYTPPVATPYPQMADTGEDIAHPAWSAQWLEKAGERNRKGFLKQGEYVYADSEQGLWFYATPALIVRVDRKSDTEEKRTWYEAHMYVDLDSGERIQSVQYTPENPGKKKVQITQIARENQVVFGMNTDYYTYRVGGSTVGIVIRNGQILHDSAPVANRSKFPNLDVLAMFDDGDWKVYHSDEYTAQEYVAMGAVNVYSFGPYMVRDGVLNEFIDQMYGGKTGQPRCALGIIEKGHYYAMLEEGRIPKEAKGTSLKALAEHMLEKGCVQALNMDGGQTAVFTFMGEQITRIGVYEANGANLPRSTSELIAAGFSSAIDPLE